MERRASNMSRRCTRIDIDQDLNLDPPKPRISNKTLAFLMAILLAVIIAIIHMRNRMTKVPEPTVAIHAAKKIKEAVTTRMLDNLGI